MKTLTLNYRFYKIGLAFATAAAIVLVSLYFYLNKDELFCKEPKMIPISYKSFTFLLPEKFSAPTLRTDSMKKGKAYYLIDPNKAIFEIPGEVYLTITKETPQDITYIGSAREYRTTGRNIKSCTYKASWGEVVGKEITFSSADDYHIICVGDEEIVDDIIDSFEVN
mgnify:CR=1 FL=1